MKRIRIKEMYNSKIKNTPMKNIKILILIIVLNSIK